MSSAFRTGVPSPSTTSRPTAGAAEKLDARCRPRRPARSVADPLRLSPAERSALLARVARTNLALFAWDPGATRRQPSAPSSASSGFTVWTTTSRPGGRRDGDRRPDRRRRTYVPYTNRPVLAHRRLLQPAGSADPCLGALLRAGRRRGRRERGARPRDRLHRLRDRNPPGSPRSWPRTQWRYRPTPARTGPCGGPVRPGVLGGPADGRLHMRYSARQRNIAWPTTRPPGGGGGRCASCFRRRRPHLASPVGARPGRAQQQRAAPAEAFSDVRPAPTDLRARYYDRVGAA